MGCFADTELILIILPHLFLFIDGKTALVNLTADKKVDSKVETQSSSLISSKKPAFGPPVLLTNTSTLPCFLIISSTILLMSSLLLKSV